MNKTKKNLLLLIVSLTILASCSKTDSATLSTSTDTRDQFVGNWLIGGNYFITITKSSASDGVIQMYNFDNLASVVSATVNSDSLYIPQQQVLTYINVTNGYHVDNISGGGYISGANTIFFSLYDNGGVSGTITGIKK